MAKASHFAKRDRQRQNQTEDCKEARVARTTVSMHRGHKIIECSVLIITVWLLLLYAYQRIVYELIIWYAYLPPDGYTGPIPMRFPNFSIVRTQHNIEWTVSAVSPLILYLSALLTYKIWKRVRHIS